MGNNRNFVILGLVVVVLVVLYAMSSQRRPSLDTSGGFVDLVEGTLSTDDVTRIELRHQGEGFTLVQGDDGWVVEDHFRAPANLNKIRTLLGNLESVSGEFRSDSGADDVLASYDLTDSAAYHLEVDGGDQPVALLIGKSSGAGCFVRRAGEDRVYLTDHNFLSDFGVFGDDRAAPKVSPWVDLLAFEADRDAVTRIRIEGDETVVLDREPVVDEEAAAAADSAGAAPAGSPGDNYEWRIDGDFIGSRSRGDAVLSSLVSIRARDVVTRGDAPEGSGLDDDPGRITVTLDGANEVTLLFGGPVEGMTGQVYFRVEGRDLVWAVPEYVKTNLFKTADELRAE